MIIISHRGYENGEEKSIENKPIQINKMLKNQYHVEIDVWKTQEGLYLGHDYPKYKIKIDFLKREGLWCHAKNPQALQYMLRNNIHCFWHQSDDYTVTSKNFIWAYPGYQTNGLKTVLLYPERFPIINYKKYYAICTDYPKQYKEKK
jgi:hypothetical protein